MDVLTKFLDHGILPFVGREAELARLLGFWRATAHAGTLRIALLAGEAGVGKSRLVQELIPLIEGEGGVVVHVRLYPGAMTSLMPLVARALAVSASGRLLLRRENVETPSSSIEGLQRISRLRPVLLIIEDIHLLAEESLVEFINLLNAMEGETLSVLCLTRPVELDARGALDRYLVEEIPLAGLDMATQRELWETLFSAPPDPSISDTLQRIALGNPLALRSALRGALKSGHLVRGKGNGRWEALPPPESLTMMIERNVGMMAGGLMLHLTPEERKGAEQLACLGEILSREGAEALLRTGRGIIEGLLRKGILATSPASMAPLSGPPSRFPLLVFTHTVLHNHLVRQAEPDPEALVAIIAADTPLYSLLPFQLLARYSAPHRIPLSSARGAITTALDLAFTLDCGPDWEQALSVWDAAEMLYRTCADLFDEEERKVVNGDIIYRRLTLLRRASYAGEYAIWTERYLEFTERPVSPAMAEHRLRALRFLFDLEIKRGSMTTHTILEQAERLQDDFPELRRSYCYLEYMEGLARIGWTINIVSLLEDVERKLAPFLADENTPEEQRRFIRKAIMPFLLLRFTTPEELGQRFDLLAQLDADADPSDLVLLTQKLELFWVTGRFDAMQEVLAGGLPQLKQRGLHRFFNRYAFMDVARRSAFGLELDALAEKIVRIGEESLTEISPTFRGFLGDCVCMVGLLRNDAAWSRRTLDRLLDGEKDLPARTRILLAIAEGRIEQLPMLIDIPHPSALVTPMLAPLKPLAALALGDPEAEGEAARLAGDYLLGPILRVPDITTLLAIITMIEHIGGMPGREEFARTLERGVDDAVERMIAWLARQELVAYAEGMAGRFARRIPPEKLADLRRKLAMQTERRIAREMAEEPGLLTISMLGVIRVHRPGQEPARIRGARLSALLGAMVAASMLKKPLTHREFCQLVSGESDPEYARKMMNGAVWRLREPLGQEAILTDLELPRLHPDRVRVDLLDAHAKLTRAIQAEREGSLMRAFPDLIAALDITRGEVPFPGLYDPFFEAAREDFENLQRTAVMAVATGLLNQGDPMRAEEILQRGRKMLPEDEELVLLLRRALIALGRRAEAELLRNHLDTLP